LTSIEVRPTVIYTRLVDNKFIGEYKFRPSTIALLHKPVAQPQLNKHRGPRVRRQYHI